MIDLTKKRATIRVFGIVQGVGFRPFIHKLVNEYGLKGWVQNSTSGVTIDVEGDDDDLKSFAADIREKAPDLAVVENVQIEIKELIGYSDFKIIKSDCDEEGFVLISPDVAICKDCYNELTNPADKRYRFPFINCTNCGPRFTIIKDLPYDRDKTTMSKFPMCVECNEEYHNIENRRYHAQPNCCPSCGPSLTFTDAQGGVFEGDPISKAAAMLKKGCIVAVKGLGGFHLACDALNGAAVRRLRERKHREQKPFAMMCKDTGHVMKYAEVSDEERKILESIRRPIVLLKKKHGCEIPDEIAPGTDRLGFMLPYTPIHYLLFEEEGIQNLIMTSANISDNPIIYKNEDAVSILSDIADFFLLHNRDIQTRCDDSVVKVVGGKEYFMRRSRGYAPFPIKVNTELKPILACGAEQKASFSISRGRYIFISQHIGDLKNYETMCHYEEQIENFKRLFKVDIETVACDMHPDYLSTAYAEGISGLERVYVQHHHAHMASCMADNNLEGEVIGVTWDGTGLGTDGTIWGGEILVGGYSNFVRKGSFLQAPLIGGDRAVKDIYLMGLSYLMKTYGKEYKKYLDIFDESCMDGYRLELIEAMAEKKINSPLTSSCGRLFDGVSSILGLVSTAGYEGQGAVMLESISDTGIKDVLDFDVVKQDGIYIYDWRPTVKKIVDLLKSGADRCYISSAFHNTVVSAAVRQCSMIRDENGLNRVVLSGGVFQNSFILFRMMEALRKNGFEVYIHHRVSANDEGISVGQLVIANNGGGIDVPSSTAKDNLN